MEQTFPNAEDICKIVATCRRAGVLRLRMGSLEVDFLPAVVPAKSPPPQPQVSPGAAPTPAAEIQGKPTQEQEQAEQASIEEQGIQTRELQIAELLITDPLKAEEMMEEGDLTQTGESTDGTGSGEAFDQ